jgi:hypothetical protein
MRFALFTNLGNVMTELAADVPGDAPLLLLRFPPSLLPPKLPLSLLLAAPGTWLWAALLLAPAPTIAAALKTPAWGLSKGLMLLGDAWLLARDGGAA